MLHLSLCFLGLFLWLASAQAQNPSGRDSVYLDNCTKAVQTLTPSFEGEVEVEQEPEGNPDSTFIEKHPYAIYAIQHKNNWILLVVDLSGFYSYAQWPDTDTIVENTPFVDYTLCQIITGQHLEQAQNKKKTKQVLGDLEFTDYYVLKKEGRKLWEQVIFMEYDRKSKEGLLKKLFNFGKLKDVKKTVADQQKSLSQKTKEIENLKKKVKDTEGHLQRLEEALEKAQHPPKQTVKDTNLIAKKEEAIRNDSTKTQIQIPAKDTVTLVQNVFPEDSTVALNTTSTSIQNQQATPMDTFLVVQEFLPKDTVRTETPIPPDQGTRLEQISAQRDSIQRLLEEDLEAQARKTTLHLKDSMDKVYMLELLEKKKNLDKKIPATDQSRTLATRLQGASLDALKAREDSILFALREIETLLQNTTDADARQQYFQKRNQLERAQIDLLTERRRRIGKQNNPK